MDMELTRRDLFKKAGILGAALALSGCGNRAEQRLVPFLKPPEEQVAGVFTYYASTCTECPAACGLLVKTMGGRGHKLEGNPRHPLNQGRLCARGQAGLQGLYNPDRIQSPQVRAGGRQGAWGTTNWDEGVTRLTEAIKQSASGGKRVAFLGGQVPDHLYKLASLLSLAVAPLSAGSPSSTISGVDGGGRADLTVWNLARAADGNVLLEQFATGLRSPGVSRPGRHPAALRYRVGRRRRVVRGQLRRDVALAGQPLAAVRAPCVVARAGAGTSPTSSRGSR